MGPSTRGEREKKVALALKLSLTKASNALRASKAVNGMLADPPMVPFGGDNRMRQLDGLQYSWASGGLTPPAYCLSLHSKLPKKHRSLLCMKLAEKQRSRLMKLAEKQRSPLLRPNDVDGEIQTNRLELVSSKVVGRSWLLIKLAQQLGRSILARMMKQQLSIEKQSSSSSSSYEETVTSIMKDLSLPLSKEEALLQRFQSMSLEKSSNVDDRKVVDEVDRVLGEAMAVKGGDDLFSALLKRVEQLDRVERALTRGGLVPHSLRQSLHLNLADMRRMLVPCPRDVGEIRTKSDGARLLLRDKVLRLLDPSVDKVMPDLDKDILARKMTLKPPPSIEKQELSCSTDMEMVSPIELNLDLPPNYEANYEDLVLQSLQRMSLADQEHFFYGSK